MCFSNNVSSNFNNTNALFNSIIHNEIDIERDLDLSFHPFQDITEIKINKICISIRIDNCDIFFKVVTAEGVFNYKLLQKTKGYYSWNDIIIAVARCSLDQQIVIANNQIIYLKSLGSYYVH